MAASRYHDVAFHAPFAGPLMTDPPRPSSGGAERQMTLLAAAVAEAGLRTAQIVYPDPELAARSGSVDVVQRPPTAVGRSAAREVLGLRSALRDADARTVVHRSAGPESGVIATWCRLGRRRFVYSASSTVDFTLETLSDRPRDARLHRLGLRLAHRVVAQSDEQAALAADVVDQRRIIVIPSIAEPAAPAGIGEAFVWAGGAASYKRPERFLDLAAAVPEARFLMALAARPESEQGLDVAGLHARAAALSNVEITGALSRDDLLSRLDRAVAIVNTSEFEGMPNTFLEAWARGVPALALDVDPDGAIAAHDLGVAAGGAREVFVAGARRLWAERAAGSREHVRAFVATRHAPDAVAARWLPILR